MVSFCEDFAYTLKQKQGMLINTLEVEHIQANIYQLVWMFSMFIAIYKSGIMGWRRKIFLSTILGFLIILLVFGLIKEFEISTRVAEQRVDGHVTTSTLIKNTTMWFWPAFLINKLGKKVNIVYHFHLRKSTTSF